IPINIKNADFPEERGTMIVDDACPISTSGTITGSAGNKGFAVISIKKTLMSLEKDFYRKLLAVSETNKGSVEHLPSIIDSVSLVISNTELNSKLEKIIEEICIYCNPDSIISYADMALIAVVGRGMIRNKGISAKISTALANYGVNIRMITQGSSELNVI